MKKLILILLSLTIFYSCANDPQKNTTQNSYTENVIGYSVTSKNTKLTSKSGKEVSMSEMTTQNVESGEKVLFKSYYFTLDNSAEGAFNFYSNNGRLICNAPTVVSVMSMPPSGNGVTTFNKGDNIEISGMTLIKTDSISFVISEFIVKTID